MNLLDPVVLGALLLVLASLFILGLVAIYKGYRQSDQIDELHERLGRSVDHLQAFAQLFGGGLLVVSVSATMYGVYQNISQFNAQHSVEQKSQALDRFKFAAEKMGSKTDAAYVSALSVLLQLSRECPEDYLIPAFDVISASLTQDPDSSGGLNGESSGEPKPPADTGTVRHFGGKKAAKMEMRQAEQKAIYVRRKRVTLEYLSRLLSHEVVKSEYFRENRHQFVLRRLDIRKQILSGVRIPPITVENSNFSGAQLDGADLSEVHFTNANFTGTVLTKAKLIKTSLQKANLTDAGLVRADLSGANLRDATVAGVRPFGTILACADLHGVNFSLASTTSTSTFLNAFIDSTTTLPSGTSREEVNAFQAENNTPEVCDQYKD